MSDDEAIARFLAANGATQLKARARAFAPPVRNTVTRASPVKAVEGAQGNNTVVDFGNDTDYIFSDDQLPAVGLYVLAFFRDRRLGGDYATVACRTDEYGWEEQSTERRINFDPLCWSLITKPDEVPHCEESPYYTRHTGLRNPVASTN